MSRYTTPPSLDELEISIFGPGIGECISIHVGNNEWIIVDSCISRHSNEPIALEYLRELGIDPVSSVKLFVVTHWHDDHIRGAARILNTCCDAKFAYSDALNCEEFFKFARSYGEQILMENSGVDEFNLIFKELLRSQKPVRSEPERASADRRLLYLSKDDNRPFNVEVFSLSPSDAAKRIALQEISQLIPEIKTTKRRAISRTPNYFSVALWITIENWHILLGSDLENLPNNNVGWKAVVMSTNRPRGRAFVVKLPHHGSRGAYCEEMWLKMLSPEPIALVTPFSSGKKPLPSDEDIAILSGHTSKIYCTGPPRGWQPPRRESAVEKTMKEMCLTHRLVYGKMGQVRVRLSIKDSLDDPQIELFNGAIPLIRKKNTRGNKNARKST